MGWHRADPQEGFGDMTKFKSVSLMSASALALTVVLGSAAFAQDGENATENGEFLGTITLGEGKREVQTDTPTALTVIDRDELRDRQASTVAELIDSVPGVTLVNGSTPTGSGINIRGFGANNIFGTDQKVQIFIDGATTGSEEIYRIGTQLFTDPYLYRSVEVQRGTVGSFEYGSGIVGGIVLLETINASDLTGGEVGFNLAQTLGAYSNSGGFSTSTTLAFRPTEQAEFLVNYTYREQDEQDDGDGNTIGNSAFELPSLLVKGRVMFGDANEHSLTGSFTQSEVAERDVPYDTFITATDFFGNVDRDIESQSASLTYAYSPLDNDLFDLEAILSYSNQEIDQAYIPGSSPIAPPGGFGVVNADLQFETTKLTVRNESFVENENLDLNFRYGFELIRRERLDANSAPGGVDNRFALFAVTDINPTPEFTITPALRYESSEIDDAILNNGSVVSYSNDALMGGLSARYEFPTGFAVFASYAHTENLPILDDLENPIFMQQPEVATTIEGGISYDGVAVFNEQDFVAVKVNLYNTQLDDVTSYSGVAEVEINGLEIEGTYALANGFYIDLNANFTSGDETRTAGQVVDWRNVPQDSVRVTAGRRFGDFIDLSAEVLSVFETTRSGLGFGGVPTTTTADGFTLVNVRATVTPQEGFLAGTEFRFGLENAFDEAYSPLLSTRPAPGQNFKITVSRVFF